MNATHVICATLEVQRCRAELYVNGFPLARLGPDGIVGTGMPVQQFLVPGTNEIELLIEPGSHPSVARTAARELDRRSATATARLLRFPDGAMMEVENGELLCEVSWEGKPDGGEGQPALLAAPNRYPKSIARQVDLGALAGRWSWQDAPELQPDAALIDEARAVLDALKRAIESGSAPAYSALVEEATREGARAYPVREARRTSELHAAFVAHYAAGKPPVLPLDRTHHDFRLVAGDRVLECVDDDFTPSLKLRDPETGAALPFSMLLARIDGRLQVVR
jgi:hypothetical protein